ncbi:MAG TPA: type II toxin-antitoxin system RelE/ParE family toxin [Nostocaceae cyanobacterium]|nr:type II toxin-antitoxin system RelE/ParE family toxin [Nostocaceae cyanobacterium]
MSANLPILLDTRAEEDIDAAAQWYAEQNPELALEFLDAVNSVFERLTQFPLSCPEIKSNIRRTLTNKFPFCVYYSVNENYINILAVLHIRRSPDTWQQRIT